MLNEEKLDKKTSKLANVIKLYFNFGETAQPLSDYSGEVKRNLENLKQDIALSQLTPDMLSLEWKPSARKISVSKEIEKIQKIYDKLLESDGHKIDGPIAPNFKNNYYKMLVYTRAIWVSLHSSSAKKAMSCFNKFFSISTEFLSSGDVVLYIYFASLKLLLVNSIRYAEYLNKQNNTSYDLYCNTLKWIRYLNESLKFKITGNLHKDILDKMDDVESKHSLIFSDNIFNRYSPHPILNLSSLKLSMLSLRKSINIENFKIDNDKDFQDACEAILYKDDINKEELIDCFKCIESYFVRKTNPFNKITPDYVVSNNDIYTYLFLKNTAALIQYRFRLYNYNDQIHKELIKKLNACLKKFNFEDKRSLSDFLNDGDFLEFPYPSLVSAVYADEEKEQKSHLSITNLNIIFEEIKNNSKTTLDAMVQSVMISLGLIEIYLKNSDFSKVNDVIIFTSHKLNRINDIFLDSISQENKYNYVYYIIVKFIILMYGTQVFHFKWLPEKNLKNLKNCLQFIEKSNITEFKDEKTRNLLSELSISDKKFEKISFIFIVLDKVSSQVVRFLKFHIDNDIKKIEQENIFLSIANVINLYNKRILSLEEKYLSKPFSMSDYQQFTKECNELCFEIENSNIFSQLSDPHSVTFQNNQLVLIDMLNLFVFYYKHENSKNAQSINPVVLKLIISAMGKLSIKEKDPIEDFVCYWLETINQHSPAKYSFFTNKYFGKDVSPAKLCFENEKLYTIELKGNNNDDLNPAIIFSWLRDYFSISKKTVKSIPIFDFSKKINLGNIFAQFKKSNYFIRRMQWDQADQLLSSNLYFLDNSLDFYRENTSEIYKNIYEFIDCLKLQTLHRIRIGYCLLQSFNRSIKKELNIKQLKKISEQIKQSRELLNDYYELINSQKDKSELAPVYEKFLGFYNLCQHIYSAYNSRLIGFHNYFNSMQKSALICKASPVKAQESMEEIKNITSLDISTDRSTSVSTMEPPIKFRSGDVPLKSKPRSKFKPKPKPKPKAESRNFLKPMTFSIDTTPIVHPVWDYESSSDDEIGQESFKNLSPSESEDKKSIDPVGISHEWVPFKKIPPIYFSQSLGHILVKLISFFSHNKIKIMIKGGAPRDFLLEFPINDIDMAFMLPISKMLFSIELINFLNKLGARKNKYIENLYQLKYMGTCIDMLISTADFVCDALLNSFVIIPNDDITDLKGTYFFNKAYFSNEDLALEHIKNRILQSPGDAQKHLEEDIIRILRYLRLSLTRKLLIGKDEVKTFVVLSKQFNSTKLLENAKIRGRILSELGKIPDDKQIDYLKSLKKHNILHHLFSAYPHSFQSENHLNPKMENFLNLLNRGFSLKNLYKIHSIGCNFWDSIGQDTPSITRPDIFMQQAANYLILLNFKLNYQLSFSRHNEEVKHFPKEELIKDHWEGLTKELSILLLNKQAEKNFLILLRTGFFEFLFPKAYQLIIKNAAIFHFIKRCLYSTQMIAFPSLKFILYHFLAIESVGFSSNKPADLEKMYDGRYRFIISSFNERFKDMLRNTIQSVQYLAMQDDKSSSPAAAPEGLSPEIYNHQRFWNPQPFLDTVPLQGQLSQLRFARMPLG